MGKLSNMPVKTAVDGSEWVPIYNDEPTQAYPEKNYRVEMAAMAAFFGAATNLFAQAVSESAADVIDGTSQETGDIVYLQNAGVFAKRVTLGSGEQQSTKYYTQFTDTHCHAGEPDAGKLYMCAQPPSLYAKAGSAFLQLTIPTEWMTEEEFEQATLEEGKTYITYESE